MCLKNKKCENCSSFLMTGKNTGMCSNLSIAIKKSIFILDSYNIIKSLNWEDKIPALNRVIVSKNFSCRYWQLK